MSPNRHLRQARELRGWSQAKVAEQIGTDATTVSRWERGLFSPTPYFREKLCTLFGMNAGELGLLEPMRRGDGAEKAEGTSSYSASPLNSQQRGMNEPAEFLEPSDSQPLLFSKTDRADAFEYILQSARRDQQAYMLWENAYVHALLGQHAEAQQLGEASLNVFEDIDHPHAAVVRAWMTQHGLSSSATEPDPLSSSTLSGRGVEHKNRSKIFPRGLSLYCLLFVGLMSLLLSGMLFDPLHLSSLSLHLPSSSSVTTTSLPTGATSPSSAQATVTLTTSEGKLQPSSTQESGTKSSTLEANPGHIVVAPSLLTPRNCVVEYQRYRCTLSMTLNTSSLVPFSWKAMSAGIISQFSPANGISMPGQPVQVIAYISKPCEITGSFVFIFTSVGATGATNPYSTSVAWTC